METTPMTFMFEIPRNEWDRHPLRDLWNNIPFSHPTYGSTHSFALFLKREHNINIIGYKFFSNSVAIEFQSKQDYTLWQLHQ